MIFAQSFAIFAQTFVFNQKGGLINFLDEFRGGDAEFFFEAVCKA